MQVTIRLRYVSDAVVNNANTPVAQDIQSQAANNYRYDAIGNLTQDIKEGSDIILGDAWNPIGNLYLYGFVGRTGLEWDNQRQAEEQTLFTTFIIDFRKKNLYFTGLYLQGERTFGVNGRLKLVIYT